VRFTQDAKVHRRSVENLKPENKQPHDDIIEVENYKVDNCRIGIVSYDARRGRSMRLLNCWKAEGVKIGHVA